MSPIVLLELEYLYETRRIAERGAAIVDDLKRRVRLELCPLPFASPARFSGPAIWD